MSIKAAMAKKTKANTVKVTGSTSSVGGTPFDSSEPVYSGGKGPPNGYTGSTVAASLGKKLARTDAQVRSGTAKAAARAGTGVSSQIQSRGTYKGNGVAKAGPRAGSQYTAWEDAKGGKFHVYVSPGGKREVVKL